MRLETFKIYTGTLLALVISLSLTISTLHSHNHIEWHHPQNHIDTGTCLTVDSTDCPICGYLFHADIASPETAEAPIFDTAVLADGPSGWVQESGLHSHSGRSPPVLI